MEKASGRILQIGFEGSSIRECWGMTYIAQGFFHQPKAAG